MNSQGRHGCCVPCKRRNTVKLKVHCFSTSLFLNLCTHNLEDHFFLFNSFLNVCTFNNYLWKVMLWRIINQKCFCWLWPRPYSLVNFKRPQTLLPAHTALLKVTERPTTQRKTELCTYLFHWRIYHFTSDSKRFLQALYHLFVKEDIPNHSFWFIRRVQGILELKLFQMWLQSG